jgi:nicotinamide mononucleotide transporter
VNIIDINNILFEILGYKVSLIELIGTVTGLISVYYAVKANVLTWSIGLINAAAFFILFYQVNLYSDMFLQVWFFIIGIYGWIKWKKIPAKKTISHLNYINHIILILLISCITILLGLFMANIHLIFPVQFSQPAAYPYFDSFTTISSIIAVNLMAEKKIESWVIWIVVDIICIFLYLSKGVFAVSIEYVLFFILALSGLINWIKLFKNEKRISLR